jgi:hypothetical protein
MRERFPFRPTRVLEDLPDGSLTVRFNASGHLEMCWHLYMWGDQVEVLAPEVLRKMVEPYRLKLKLACELPTLLHGLPPAPLNTLTRCLRNRVQASSAKRKICA